MSSNEPLQADDGNASIFSILRATRNKKRCDEVRPLREISSESVKVSFCRDGVPYQLLPELQTSLVEP